MKPYLAFFAAFFVFISPLAAHPSGHAGGFFETVTHMLTHPDHLVVLGAALVLGGCLAWKGFRYYRAKH